MKSPRRDLTGVLANFSLAHAREPACTIGHEMEPLIECMHACVCSLAGLDDGNLLDGDFNDEVRKARRLLRRPKWFNNVGMHVEACGRGEEVKWAAPVVLPPPPPIGGPKKKKGGKGKAQGHVPTDFEYLMTFLDSHPEVRRPVCAAVGSKEITFVKYHVSCLTSIN